MSLIDLLRSPEATAVYIAVFFGLIGWFANRWVTQKRPKKIKVLRMGQASVLTVNPTVKDDLEIIYKKIPVSSLYGTLLTLHNTSDDTIDNVRIKLVFSDPNVVLDVRVDDVERQIMPESVYEPNEAIQIAIPYVKSKKLHKDVLKINVFSRDPIEIKIVLGGGREWSVEYFDYEAASADFINRLSENLGNPVVGITIALLNIPKMIRLAMARR